MKTEKSSDGRIRSGVTSPLGNGSITTWSDGTTTRSSNINNGSIINESYRNGQPTRAIVQPYSNGSRTSWNNGSTNYNQKFSNGTMNYDRKSK
jgi:hypothetical protein